MPASTWQGWVDQVLDAINKGDFETALALYDTQAVMVAEPGSPVQGHAAISAVFAGFAPLNGTMKGHAKGVVEGPAHAVLYMPWTFEGAGPDGPVNLGGDATVVLARQADGTLLCVVDDFFSAG